MKLQVCLDVMFLVLNSSDSEDNLGKNLVVCEVTLPGDYVTVQ